MLQEGSFICLAIMKKFFQYYLPLVLWMALIFWLSSVSDLKSGAQTVSNELIIRKIAHTGEYAILSMLFFHLFFKGYGLSLRKAGIFAVLGATIYALSDEFHQTLVLGRTGKATDVLVDFLGSVSGIVVCIAFVRRKITGKMAAVLIASVAIIASITYELINQALDERGGLNDVNAAKLSEANIRDEKNSEVAQSVVVQEEQSASHNEEKKDPDVLSEKEKTIQPIVTKREAAAALPAKILLDVPFTTQAPFANWDEMHEETCEEASLMMLNAFLKKIEKLPPEEVEKELQQMRIYQEKKFGDYKDSTMEELIVIGSEFYGLKNLKVVYDFEKEDIKKELANGNPVILPTAGRKLGNPNFKQPGPWYHNLLVIGYDGDMIITNDPGTRNGQKYQYSLDVLYRAVHDFPGKPEEIEKGRKAMIVVVGE
jgi:VanZ family protein